MKQGEIWEINLNPTVGAEIKKKRPAVIINRDHPIHPPKATILIILAEGNHPTIRSAGILPF